MSSATRQAEQHAPAPSVQPPVPPKAPRHVRLRLHAECAGGGSDCEVVASAPELQLRESLVRFRLPDLCGLIALPEGTTGPPEALHVTCPNTSPVTILNGRNALTIGGKDISRPAGVHVSLPTRLDQPPHRCPASTKPRRTVDVRIERQRLESRYRPTDVWFMLLAAGESRVRIATVPGDPMMCGSGKMGPGAMTMRTTCTYVDSGFVIHLDVDDRDVWADVRWSGHMEGKLQLRVGLRLPCSANPRLDPFRTKDPGWQSAAGEGCLIRH